MKINYKKLIIIPAAVLTMLNNSNTEAKSISPAEALARVKAELSTGVSEMPSLKPETYKLAYTHEAVQSVKRPMMYIFTPNTGKGFVLSSANDEFPAILGYSNNSDFDASNISPDMQWWLGQYEQEMEWILAHPASAAAAERTELGEPVAPMLKTQWNQNAPYNNYTPAMMGRQTATGCVATAMAQIMKYHNYPAQGEGWITYKWTAGNKMLSCYFDDTIFDWSNMLDNYEKDGIYYTQTEADAVATLMMACGYSVKMNYDVNASGTSSYLPAAAFANNFKYNKGVYNLSRDYTTIMDWEKTIYSNIASNMPVLLTGQSPYGGHAFVCDGYSSNHYFHINWGWGGFQDGYFLLSMLNPASGGIGSSEGAYNSMQTAVVNIKPEEGGTSVPAQLRCNGNFTYGGYNATTKEYSFQALGVTAPGFYNFDAITFKGQVGVIIEYPDNHTVDYPYNYTTDLEAGYGLSYIPVTIKDKLSEGVYNVYPAFRRGGEGPLIKMEVCNGCNPYLVMTVDAQGNASFTDAPVNPNEIPEIEVTDFKCLDSEIYRNYPATFSVTVQNKSDKLAYTEPIKMRIGNGDVFRQEKDIYMTVWPDESFTQTAALTWSAAVGEYDVTFLDANGKIIGSGYKINIVSGAPSNLQSHITITDITPTTLIANQEQSIMATYKNDYPMPIKIPVTIKVYDNTEKELLSYDITSISFPANTTSMIRISGINTNFGVGNYTMKFFSGEDAISEKFPFSVKELAESFSINPKEVTLELNKTITLSTEVLPADAIIGDITWKSDNDFIATVSRSGIVRGVKEGQATITATSGNLTATCEVTVVKELNSIDTIIGDDEIIKNVTTSDGKVLYGITSKEQIEQLTPGVYFINVGGRTVKVMIGSHTVWQ